MKVHQTQNLPSANQRQAGQAPTSAAPSTEPVLLIHGTAANRIHAGELDWWCPGSAFSKQMDRLLETASSPARCWAHLEKGARPFAWTGNNSEIERRGAGTALAEHLMALENDPAVPRYHVVAHSHGGNVLLNALRGLPNAPRKLGAVVFLGTPVLVFRHAGAVDPRWVSLPVCAVMVAAAVYQLMQAGTTQFIWVPVLASALFAIAAELLLAPRAVGRSESGLYGSGRPRAFVFSTDEAVRALYNAQHVVNWPLLFIAQFVWSGPAPGHMVKPFEPREPSFEDSLHRSGAYQLWRWFSSRESSNVGMPMRPAGLDRSAAPGALASNAATQLGNALAALDTALAGFPMWKPIVYVTLFIAACVPVSAIALAAAAAGAVSRRLSSVARWVVLNVGVSLGMLSLPILLRKAAFGEDSGKFVSVGELPPGVDALQPIPADLIEELSRVDGRFSNNTGRALLAAMAKADPFTIKANIENALRDTSLVHSHYYRAQHVLDHIAQFIAQPAKQVSGPHDSAMAGTISAGLHQGAPTLSSLARRSLR